MKYMLRLVASLVLVAAAAPALASGEDCEDRIYSVGGPCLEGAAKSTKGELPQASRQIDGFILGKHSFDRAEEIFGKAKTWKSGDAAASEDKICYVSENGKELTTLIFAANSEMSGGVIDGITVIGGPVKFQNKCARLPANKFSHLAFKSGIRLGMSQKQLKAILGKPSEVKNGLMLFSYCVDKKTSPSSADYEYCPVATRCSGMTTRFVNDKLKWIEIGYGDWVC